MWPTNLYGGLVAPLHMIFDFFQVVYVGDSLRSDVWPTNLYAGWTSVLILEEMEAEGLVDDDKKGQRSDENEEGPPAKLAKMKVGYCLTEMNCLFGQCGDYQASVCLYRWFIEKPKLAVSAQPIR